MKKTLIFLFAAISALITGCGIRDAEVVSQNLSNDADNFKVERRIVFYNGITNDYMLTIEGRCSMGSASSSKGITVTCNTGPGQYKKHILGLSDNVTYFVEQIDPNPSSTHFYKVTFKPSVIIPNVELR